jgi:hypothetical protein
MRRFAILLLSGLAVASTLLAVELAFEERPQIASGYGDFIIFYTGAQILRDGLGSDLYDLSVQRQYQSKFDVAIRSGPLPYNHPPFELLWHIPLTYLSYVNAYLAWSVVNLFFLILLHRWLGRSDDRNFTVMSVFMLTGFYPVTVALLHGQDSILLCVLMGASFWMLQRGKNALAGVLVAMALIKPQFALPVMAVGLAPSRMSAVKSSVIAASALIGISLIMIGYEGAIKYRDLLATIDRLNYTIAPQNMPNLRGLIYSALNHEYPQLIFPAVALLTLGIYGFLAMLWAKAPRDSNDTLDLRFALTITLVVLASYHCYIHDLSLMLLPAMLIAKRLSTTAGNWSLNQRLLAIILAILWIPFPLTYRPLLLNELFAWASLLLMTFAALIGVELKQNLRFPTADKVAS